MGVGLDIDPSIRIVTHEETFDDLAVRELAKGRAACICRLQYGRCKPKECKSCAKDQRFRNCYMQLNDYNKERLGSYIGDYYQAYAANPTGWKSFKFLVTETAIFLLIVLAMLVIPVLVLAGHPQDRPQGIPRDLDRKIVYCMNETQKRVYDRNYDQKVNCIDYTVTFKEQWDRMYPSTRKQCEIIRNKSTRMNHLFIGIVYNGGYIFVEPWAYNIERYLMSENWDGRYQEKYNYYGETSRWMKEKMR